MVNQVLFLEYVISRDGITMDQCKVHTIFDWLEPKTLREAWCFHTSALFCHRFIYNFSTIMAPYIAWRWVCFSLLLMLDRVLWGLRQG